MTKLPKFNKPWSSRRRMTIFARSDGTMSLVHLLLVRALGDLVRISWSISARGRVDRDFRVSFLPARDAYILLPPPLPTLHPLAHWPADLPSSLPHPSFCALRSSHLTLFIHSSSSNSLFSSISLLLPFSVVGISQPDLDSQGGGRLASQE